MRSQKAKFSTNGLGEILADAFDNKLNASSQCFPNLQPRGKTLTIVSDYGGQHKSSKFETFSFLVFDLEQNKSWLSGQRHFRSHILKQNRRFSYKNLNDNMRRRALLPFLNLADQLNGWLVTLCIQKNMNHIFLDYENELEVRGSLGLWKSRPAEKLMRILHFSGFLVSGLATPKQDVLWICDEDDIAANVHQLTQLTKLFGNVVSNSIEFDLGHLRCGTTKSDDGTLTLEDLASICDLSAGAFADVVSKMKENNLMPRKKIFTHIPTNTGWKTGIIYTWLANPKTNLMRVTCIIDEGEKGAVRSTIINPQAIIKPNMYPNILRS